MPVSNRWPGGCSAAGRTRSAGHGPRAVAELLAADGIYCWDGNYYALSLMRAFGLEGAGGAVRAGFLHYTTPAEVDALWDAIEKMGPADTKV